MHADALRAHQQHEYRQKLAGFGILPSLGKTPDELTKFIREEGARYREVIQASGVRGDL